MESLPKVALRFRFQSQETLISVFCSARIPVTTFLLSQPSPVPASLVLTHPTAEFCAQPAGLGWSPPNFRVAGGHKPVRAAEAHGQRSSGNGIESKTQRTGTFMFQDYGQFGVGMNLLQTLLWALFCDSLELTGWQRPWV